MEILIFFVLHWYLSLFTQTFFHHRYAAHKMFTMSRFSEKVFFILSGIFQGSSYLSPYAYGALHRMHHAFADTEKDPHSPKFSKNVFDMMNKTKVHYSNIAKGKIAIEERFTKDLPKWTACDNFFDSWAIRLTSAATYIAFYIAFAGYWWMYLLLPIHFIMGPFHGAIINWCAHKVGYVNFKVKDTSKNLFPIDFFMLGEGFHNNHHKFGGRANFGFKWYEFDPIYPIIKGLHLARVIRLRKEPQPLSQAA